MHHQRKSVQSSRGSEDHDRSRLKRDQDVVIRASTTDIGMVATPIVAVNNHITTTTNTTPTTTEKQISVSNPKVAFLNDSKFVSRKNRYE
jgi:hypothetical protein